MTNNKHAKKPLTKDIDDKDRSTDSALPERGATPIQSESFSPGSSQSAPLGILSPTSSFHPTSITANPTGSNTGISPHVFEPTIFTPTGPPYQDHEVQISSPQLYSPRPLILSSVEGDLLHFFVQNVGPWVRRETKKCLGMIADS